MHFLLIIAWARTNPMAHPRAPAPARAPASRGVSAGPDRAPCLRSEGARAPAPAIGGKGENVPKDDTHQQALRTRAQMLRGAAIEIGRHGYEAASLTDIAVSAGRERTAMRYHFATKDEFAADILCYQVARWRQIRETVAEAGLTGIRAALAMQHLAIRQFIAEPHARAAVHLLAQSWILSLDLPSPGTLTDWNPHFRAFVEEEIRTRKTPPGIDADAIAEILTDTLLGRVLRIPPGEDHDLLAQAEPVWRTVLAALGIDDPDAVIHTIPQLDLPDPPPLPERNRHTRAAEKRDALRPRLVPRRAGEA